MTPDVGDWRIATLTVTPADETTTAALTVVAPDGTETTLTTTPDDTRETWTSEAYQLTAPGEWVERWTVTGTGAGAQRAIVRVAPDPTATPDVRVYASTADLATWLGSAPPPGARRALAAASRAVDELLLTACYATDDQGLPTDPAVVDALRDATCAQAAYQAALGDLDGTGAQAWSEVQLGSARLVRSQHPGETPGRHAPQAVQILRSAGLLNHPPLVVG